ncbi:hypothetical protein KIN20_006990, partial [Parelaphostrongylus tenuis]
MMKCDANETERYVCMIAWYERWNDSSTGIVDGISYSSDGDIDGTLDRSAKTPNFRQGLYKDLK